MKALMIYSPDLPKFMPKGSNLVAARRLLYKDKSLYSEVLDEPIYLIDVQKVTRDLLEFIAFVKVRGNRVIVHTIVPAIKKEQVLCDAMMITKIPHDILYAIDRKLRVRDFKEGEIFYRDEEDKDEGSFITPDVATSIASKLFL